MVCREGNQLRRSRQWLLVFLALPAFALAQGRVIDRSVALIDGQVLTLSELQFETRVLLVHSGGVQAAFVPPEELNLRKALDSVIGQRLETAEADKLRAYPLEEGELERAVQSFANSLGGPGEFDRFLKQSEADESMLAVVIGRILRTQRVLDGKLRLRAQVTEVEAKRVQSERAELRNLPLPMVRQKLFTERFTAMAAAELAQVRKAGSVRLLGPFAPGLDTPDGGVL
jgi:hypothetical protein